MLYAQGILKHSSFSLSSFYCWRTDINDWKMPKKNIRKESYLNTATWFVKVNRSTWYWCLALSLINKCSVICVKLDKKDIFGIEAGKSLHSSTPGGSTTRLHILAGTLGLTKTTILVYSPIRWVVCLQMVGNQQGNSVYWAKFSITQYKNSSQCTHDLNMTQGSFAILLNLSLSTVSSLWQD